MRERRARLTCVAAIPPKVRRRNAANAGALPHRPLSRNPHVRKNQARVGSARRVDRVLSLPVRDRSARLLGAHVDAQRRRRSVERRDRAGRRGQPGDRATARRAHQPVACRHADGARRAEARGHHPPRGRVARGSGQGVRRTDDRAGGRRHQPRARRGAHRALSRAARRAGRTRAVPRRRQHPGVPRPADPGLPGRVHRRTASLHRLWRHVEPRGARHDRRRHAVVQVGRHRAAGGDARGERRDLRGRAARGRRAAGAGRPPFRADRAGPSRRSRAGGWRVRDRPDAARPRRDADEYRGHRAHGAPGVRRDPPGRGRDRGRQRRPVGAHGHAGRVARGNRREHGGIDRDRPAEHRQRARRARWPTRRSKRRATAAAWSTA